MVRHVIAASIFLLYLVVYKIRSIRRRPEKDRRPMKNYMIWLSTSSFFTFAFFILDPAAFHKIDFNIVGKGLTFDMSSVVTAIAGGLIVRFITEARRPELKRQTTEEERHSIFAKAMPNTYSEFSVFLLTFIILVICEELLFRQFLFASFFYTFHLKGDFLLLVSALLFTIAHSYKRPGPIAIVFISGLAFGKYFQLTGHLLYPIILHLLFNSFLIVDAIRRMRAQKLRFKPHPSENPTPRTNPDRV